MTTEQLKKAALLQQQIEELVNITKNAKMQKCEWIQFTFGNGSNREMVCNDVDTIQLVRELLINENQSKLERLRKEFAEL